MVEEDITVTVKTIVPDTEGEQTIAREYARNAAGKYDPVLFSDDKVREEWQTFNRIWKSQIGMVDVMRCDENGAALSEKLYAIGLGLYREIYYRGLCHKCEAGDGVLASIYSTEPEFVADGV